MPTPPVQTDGIVHFESVWSSRRNFEFVVTFAFYIFLNLSYVFFIYPNYSYWFELSPTVVSFVESVLILSVTFLMLPASERRIEEISLRILFALGVLPVVTLYGLTAGPRLFVWTVALGFVLMCAIVTWPTRNYFKLIEQRIGRSWPCTTSVAVVGVAVVTFFNYGGVFWFNGPPSLTALDLGAVYSVRGNFVYGHPLFGYLVSWQAKVINMFLIGFGLTRRRLSVTALGVSLQFLLYLYTGHKLFLFAIPFAVFVLYTAPRSGFLSGFFRSVAVATAVALGLYVVAGWLLPPYILVGRTFFITADTQFHYVEFFTQNRFIYLTDSKLGFFLPDQYNRDIATIIGQRYYNDSTSANTAFFADAFSHFGYIGVLVFSVVLGGGLKLMGWLHEVRDSRVTVATFILPVYSLTQTGLTTVVLTHGLAPAVLLIVLFNSAGE